MLAMTSALLQSRTAFLSFFCLVSSSMRKKACTQRPLGDKCSVQYSYLGGCMMWHIKDFLQWINVFNLSSQFPRAFLFLEHVTSQTPDFHRAHLGTYWLGPCATEPAFRGILPGRSLHKDVWPRGHSSVAHSQPSLQDPFLISSLLSCPTGGSISKYVLVFTR